MGKLLVFFSAAVLTFLLQISEGSLTYRAAVVEFHPDMKILETERVRNNLESYKKFMAEAKKKGAEIIVFPEGGLFVKATLSYIPDPADRVIPCDSLDPKINQLVKDLSCASKGNSIYSVVNLLEKRDRTPDDYDSSSKEYYIFNTNVVFDRRGMVIARYSKYNLFDEALTNHTKDPEMVFFDTDFGVRFGTFTCFDILFSFPAQRLIQQYHITDFVFPTFWFSELPFLTALQAQRGWAETNHVNLLASGVNFPQRGSSGSGIYNGKFGEIVKFVTDKATSKLLIGDVPKIQKNSASDISQKNLNFPQMDGALRRSERAANHSFERGTETELNLLQDQMYRFNSEIIKGEKSFSKTVCSGNLCCDFEVEMKALENYTCRALAYDGIRQFGQTFRGGIQSCGVVVCDGPYITNCTNGLKDDSELFNFKRIKIKGNFKPRNSFQMPTTLIGKTLTPLSTNKYVFKRVEKDDVAEVSLELVWPQAGLQVFGIWGRDFTRDMEPEVPQSRTSSTRSMSILFLSFIVFILLLR